MEKYQNFYFIGIGGIGMSALARYFHQLGKNVLGYDKTRTQLTQALENEGISIQFYDQISENIQLLTATNTLVVYTPAIKELNILDYFRNNNFTILKRAEVLGRITLNTNSIAIAGTHGKTTTSSLIAHLCKVAQLPFSAFLGGIAENYGTNFIFNGTDISVIEADEYDRSFLQLSPNYAIITSIDADHLDIYGDTQTIENSFRDFAKLVPKAHQLIVKKGIRINRECKYYAVNEEADYYSDNLRIEKEKMNFDFHHSGSIIPFSWDIPGIHNVENATAAIAILVNMGVDFPTIQKGISSFKGIKRRYTKHTFNNGKIYIDDYAHHPTELNAVISSIRTFNPNKKLLVVFQPHLFSRTRDFENDFAKSLEQADELILLDIYPAREQQSNYPNINSGTLLEKVNLKNKELCTLEQVLEVIKTKDYDIILTAGAGNIDTLYEPILELLRK